MKWIQILSVATLLGLFATQANAGHFYVGYGPTPVYAAPVYAAPVVVPAAPVYYAPAPVVYPAPVVVAPRPIIYDSYPVVAGGYAPYVAPVARVRVGPWGGVRVRYR